ncbi:MAG TPA: hypothetical protein VMV46_23360 [Thermoanaerobaculia bacterium]|nr:hypothetical protein [Thermoanaerobaculia bacterium]
MTVLLEALDTPRGQALLLHYGDRKDPRLALVDGGPRNSYDEVLRPRLEELRHHRGGTLEVDLVVVSRAVDDHAFGIVDLTDELVLLDEEDGGDTDVPYLIDDLWHNSWDDLLGPHADAMLKACRGRVPASDPHAALGRVPELTATGADLLAHVPHGRRLRHNSGLLDLHLNQGLDLITTAAGEVELGQGLSLTVLAPTETTIDRLRESSLRATSAAEAIALVQGPLHGAAALVLLAEAEGRRMLLAGGASGDVVAAALEEAGLGGVEPVRLDLVAFSPGGADQEGRRDLARRIVADRWLLCGDGGADPSYWVGLLETLRASAAPPAVAVSGIPSEALAGGVREKLEAALGSALVLRREEERSLTLQLRGTGSGGVA